MWVVCTHKNRDNWAFLVHALVFIVLKSVAFQDEIIGIFLKKLYRSFSLYLYYLHVIHWLKFIIHQLIIFNYFSKNYERI